MISYKPLHHTLVDKGLKITNVCRELRISSTIRTKLNKDQPVSLKTIAAICNFLEVPIEDVVEIIEDSE